MRAEIGDAETHQNQLLKLSNIRLRTFCLHSEQLGDRPTSRSYKGAMTQIALGRAF